MGRKVSRDGKPIATGGPEDGYAKSDAMEDSMEGFGDCCSTPYVFDNTFPLHTPTTPSARPIGIVTGMCPAE